MSDDNIVPIAEGKAWPAYAATARAMMLRTGIAPVLADRILAALQPRWRAILLAGAGKLGTDKLHAAIGCTMRQLMVLQAELEVMKLVAEVKAAAAADPGADPGGDRPPAA